MLGLGWNSLYLIGYAGTANVGDTAATYTRLGDYKVDAGLGLEAAISYRDYRAFLGGLVAKTWIHGVGGARFLLSLKTFR